MPGVQAGSRVSLVLTDLGLDRRLREIDCPPLEAADGCHPCPCPPAPPYVARGLRRGTAAVGLLRVVRRRRQGDVVLELLRPVGRPGPAEQVVRLRRRRVEQEQRRQGQAALHPWQGLPE